MGLLASELEKKIKAGDYDSKLKELYPNEIDLGDQRDRYGEAVSEFLSLYGDSPVSIFRAAGRTEVGGNHTDHQHGKVITASVDMDIIAVATPAEGNQVSFKSKGYKAIELSLDDLSVQESEKETTRSLIRGVAFSLNERGFNIGGFKAYATSRVLSGSGLSSSAAVEVLIGNLIFGLYNEGTPDPIMLAIAGKEAENNYFGKPSGLQDQMGSSVGGLIQIDFEDNDNPKVTRLGAVLGDMGYSMCILDTKGSHANLTGEYAAIPNELSQISGYFGKKVLREVDEEAFMAAIPTLRGKAGDRAVNRALHIFSENKRVDLEFEALERGDMNAFLEQVRLSGNSSFKYLQNVYPSGYKEHQEVALALGLTERFIGDRPGACRVHGGGFAGTIQVFLPSQLVSEYKEYIEKVYGEGACHIIDICKYGGMKFIG